ncbi:MAG: tRNA(fMet)-specific endonuclease VapC [Syntrophomonadaceae bacterium]|nr:tRNA(fMet)-specific endonuclease VapC [Bacillota bacterium]MBT9148456.1 tRNA(fMet)-specific endonuclease VapC [Bacillota bacterium]
MRRVFVDTLHWVAIVKPDDPWKPAAENAIRTFGQARLVTSDAVLVEVLAALAKGGPRLREAAVQMVRKIMSNPNIDVEPLTRSAFLSGLGRYENRLDKEYSLTDCISMDIMERAGITEVLTNDHHFEQDGFMVLIKKE